MDGFKSNPKMQCFKEGGSVKYESRKEHKEEMSTDIKQDKAVVKKAFKMHDEQEHKGEHTNLSKLKKGGRAKKAVGTVKKYKCGGGVYGAKKTAEDIKNIDAAKDCKPKKLCGGKSVSKYAPGGTVAQMSGQGAISETERAAMQNALPGGQGIGSANDMERRRMMARAKNAMQYLGPQQQNQFIQQGGMSQGAPAGSTIPGGMKKGGKACK